MNDLARITAIAVPGPLVYVVVLVLPDLSPTGFGSLPAYACFAALVVAALDCIQRLRNPPGGTALTLYLVTVFCFFGLAQRLLWTDWVGNPWTWHGLLPWADSSDYFMEAVGLLTEGQYESLHGRPLHTSTLALGLYLTGFDFAVLSALTCAAAAASCALAGVSVWRSHGLGAAAFFCAVMFAFYHYVTGSLMTEPLGFIYGALGFTACWEAARYKQMQWFVWALAAVTLGQCVRVGPMFLPLFGLPLFALWTWRSRHGKRPWPAALAMLCMVLAILWAHSQFNRTLAPGSGGSFANAADSIYRLVIQGEAKLGRFPEERLRDSAPWLQIYDDHPGLEELPQEQQVREKRSILFDALTRSPLALLTGAGPEWNEYFFDLQFLPFPSLYDNDGAALLIAALVVLGFVRIIGWESSHQGRLALFANLAIFASVPFLIGGQTRVYAATMGFTAILTAFGIHTLTRAQPSPMDQPRNGLFASSISALGALLMIALVVPIVLGGIIDRTHISEQAAQCESGTTLRYIIPGLPLNLGSSEVTTLHEVTVPRLRHVIAGQRQMAPDPFSRQALTQVQRSVQPLHLYHGADITHGHRVLFVMAAERQLAAYPAKALCLLEEGQIHLATLPSS